MLKIKITITINVNNNSLFNYYKFNYVIYIYYVLISEEIYYIKSKVIKLIKCFIIYL